MHDETPAEPGVLGWLKANRLKAIGGVWAGGIASALAYNFVMKVRGAGAPRRRAGARASAREHTRCSRMHVRVRSTPGPVLEAAQR